MFDLKRLLRKSHGTAPTTGTAETPADLAETLDQAVRSYSEILDSIAVHAPGSPRALKDQHAREIRKIREDVEFGRITSRGLRETQKRVDSQLKGYGKALEKHLEQHQRDAKDVMALVASMAESIATQEKQNQVRFKGIAKKLRLLTTSEDLSEIRRKLADEAGQLEKYFDDMSRDTRAALDRVSSDLMAIYRNVHDEPWLEGGQDKTTHLPGRSDGRNTIQTRLRAGDPFCVARFAIGSLESAKGPQRQSAIAEFASRLKAACGTSGLLFRWNEDEFLLVSGAGLVETAQKVADIEESLAAIGCISAAVQPFPGESVDEIVRRLQSAAQGQAQGK